MLWILSVIIGAIVMTIARRIGGFDSFVSWAIGFFAMWTTGWWWMRQRGQTTRPFWLHTLIGAASAAVVTIVAVLLRRFV